MEKQYEITLEGLIKSGYNQVGKGSNETYIFHSYKNEKGVILKSIGSDKYQIINSYRLKGYYK